jgi:hypothetical protein
MQRTDLIHEIEAELDRIRDAEDQAYVDNIETWADVYSCCLDESPGTVLENFKKNYTSRSIGITPYDELSGGDMLQLLKQRDITDDDIVKLIIDHCEPTDCDYYVQWNEMESVQVGETEYQYDLDGTELKRLIDSATAAELEYLRILPRDVKNGHLLVYGSPCDRIVWKLDPETFLTAVAELIGEESENV